MVVATPNPNHHRNVKSTSQMVVDLPVIDLSAPRSVVAKLIVKACEDYGFFKVTNHGVPKQVISRMEEEGLAFFSKTTPEKQRAAGPPANPFGYGCKNIGNHGDKGEVEYLLFNTDKAAIAQTSKSISPQQPTKFSCAVSDYIEAVRELACELLEVIAEGLWVPDTTVFSRLIRDADSDSVFRLNHYPMTSSKVGFGEHTDPQILTILRSNDVGGLQISPQQDGVWVPVPADPDAFWVNVGDVLQAMTNGRFVSVRHRALTNSFKSRMSMGYFSGPPLNAIMKALPEMVTPDYPLIYKPFTWAEYKKTAYSLRLGDTRLNLFRIY